MVVWDLILSETWDIANIQLGSTTHLIGCPDESEDVNLRVRFHVITEQRVEVGDGRQRAVLIGHAV